MTLKQEHLINEINKLAQEIIDNDEQEFIWDKSYSWNEIFNCSIVELRESLKQLNEKVVIEADKETLDELRFSCPCIHLLWMTEVATNEAIKILVSNQLDTLENTLKM